MKTIRATMALLLLTAACSGGSDTVAIIDDVAIPTEAFTGLHVDVAELNDDEVARSALLLILHNAFTAEAQDALGITPDESLVAERFAERTESFRARGDLDEQLALRNLMRRRIQIEAELDVLRDAVSASLVRDEAPGFDLDAAYEAYLMDNAEVCIQQIQIDDVSIVDALVARLDSGEPFSDVARDVSIDSFVDREAGRSGAGGDFGCSAPTALPEGLGQAALTAPIDEPVGPIASASGVHVLWVYDRTVAPLDEVHPAVLEHAIPRQGEEMFRLWAVDVLQMIDVELDAAYGRWAVLPETDPVPTVVSPDLYGSIISD
jgi:parvulin-like peptidyl-prolyl isomerase